MSFQISELKKILFSITKHKINNFHIKSRNLQIIINTIKHQNKILLNEKINSKIRKTPQLQNKKINNFIKEKKIKTNQEQNTYFTIVSPMIGTFYRSPAPNEKPFMEINDLVNINQTVCIIEAMKLMNEIESEVNGHIVEILVKDGDIVDCGQALIRVKQK